MRLAKSCLGCGIQQTWCFKSNRSCCMNRHHDVVTPDKRLVVTSSPNFIPCESPPLRWPGGVRVHSAVTRFLNSDDRSQDGISGFLVEHLETNLSSYLHVDRQHKPSPSLPLFLLQHRVWPMFPQLWPHPPPVPRCPRFYHSSPSHFWQDRSRRRHLHRATGLSDAHRSV